MDICCLEEFKREFDSLCKNNSYKSLESAIIEYFFNKDIEELKSASNLNMSSHTPNNNQD